MTYSHSSLHCIKRSILGRFLQCESFFQMTMVSRLRFQNTPDFSFRGVLKSSGRPFTSPIYEKCRPRKISKNVKKCRRVSDIKKIASRFNNMNRISWIYPRGYRSRMWIFCRHILRLQRKAAYGPYDKYRYMLDQLMSTVNASGSHSTGQECKVPLQNARS